jgi:hypothetical protein
MSSPCFKDVHEKTDDANGWKIGSADGALPGWTESPAIPEFSFGFAFDAQKYRSFNDTGMRCSLWNRFVLLQRFHSRHKR